MLINVTKSELKTIIFNLWMHRKSDEKTNQVYEKIKPKSKIEVYLKTLKVLENVELPFEILNYVVAPKTNLSITKNIFVK